MDRRRCLAIPLIAALPLLAASAARAAVADERWSDSARARSLPLRIRWPDGNAACALVLHSHGLCGSRDGGDAWGRAWREAGFAVVHVQHPGSDSEVLRGGLLALRAAASADPLIARVADMRFVLGEILRRAGTGDGPWLRVRADAIGASGHSFGAQTVQALAGKRYRVATDVDLSASGDIIAICDASPAFSGSEPSGA